MISFSRICVAYFLLSNICVTIGIQTHTCTKRDRIVMEGGKKRTDRKHLPSLFSVSHMSFFA